MAMRAWSDFLPVLLIKGSQFYMDTNCNGFFMDVTYTTGYVMQIIVCLMYAIMCPCKISVSCIVILASRHDMYVVRV
jgi:hypothetical protein